MNALIVASDKLERIPVRAEDDPAVKWNASFALYGGLTRSQQDRGLLFPGSTVQRIPVDQHYRLTGTVILVVEIDVARIFLTDINVWHRKLSLFLLDVDGYRLQ
jgi:hypothetical protein